jgi:hypothetical protein
LGPVIEDYGRQIAQPMPWCADLQGDPVPFGVPRRRLLQRLQTLFDCWLLWGPSIPLCTCMAWHGGSGAAIGFGDESNSLALLPERALSTEALRALRQRAGPRQHTCRQGIGVLGCALGRSSPARLTGPSDLVRARRSRLALHRRAANPAGGSMEELSARYYSAYLWPCSSSATHGARHGVSRGTRNACCPFSSTRRTSPKTADDDALSAIWP